ncbi:MAG: hypothetical protein VW146_01105 [Gammaproteobacteria bacterium]
MNTVKFLTLLILLSSCSYISGPNGLFPETADDFFEEEVAADIVIPSSGGDLQLITDNHYPYFDKDPDIAEIGVPKPRQIFSSGQTKQVQLRKLGDTLWVYVETLPSTSWPIAKSYFETSAYEVLSADPSSGRIVMTYKEGVQLIASVEHGIKEASTEVSLMFTDLENNQLLDDTYLQFQQNELQSLLQYFADSVSTFSGTSLAAQNLNEKKKSKILTINEQTIIELSLNFERSWSAVSRAIEDAKVSVNDRNRDQGFFLVSFATDEDRRGWFRFLNFDNEEERTLDLSQDPEFRVVVKEEAGKTRVFVESLKGDLAGAEELLSEINKLLT